MSNIDKWKNAGYNMRLFLAADMFPGQFHSMDMIVVALESEFQIVRAPDKSSVDVLPAAAPLAVIVKHSRQQLNDLIIVTLNSKF